MHTKLQVEIVTHEGVVFQGEADGVVAPGVDGYFGLLPRHAPMISELGIGDLRIRQGDEWLHFAFAGGILHVREGAVLVMGDAVEHAADIDVERARAAADRARRRLADRGRHDVDFERAEIALMRAINRLRVAGVRAD